MRDASPEAPRPGPTSAVSLVSRIGADAWRRLRIFSRATLLVSAALLLLLLGANALECYRFHRAMRAAEKLGQEKLAQLATACTAEERFGGPRRFSGDEIPKAFQVLRPLRATFYPKSTDIHLCEFGEERRGINGPFSADGEGGYVFLRISTSSDNQTITTVGGCGGMQVVRLAWIKDRKLHDRLNPAGRIITVTVPDGSSSRTWIVLANEIRIVDYRGTVGGTDCVVFQQPLDPAARRQIEQEIAQLPLTIRGRIFESGVIDGTSLGISFAPDGKRGRDRIVLDNTWREEVAPLLAAIDRTLPAEHRIPERTYRALRTHWNDLPQTSLSIDEWEERQRFVLPLWRLWPRYYFAASAK